MLHSVPVTVCPPRYAEGVPHEYTARPNRRNEDKQIAARYAPLARPDCIVKTVKPRTFLKMIELAHAN